MCLKLFLSQQLIQEHQGSKSHLVASQKKSQIFFLFSWWRCADFSFRASDGIWHIQSHFQVSNCWLIQCWEDQTLIHVNRWTAPCLLKSSALWCEQLSELPHHPVWWKNPISSKKQQMDLIRYWSPTHDEVWCTYYWSLFFSHTNGKTVARSMYGALKEDGF